MVGRASGRKYPPSLSISRLFDAKLSTIGDQDDQIKDQGIPLEASNQFYSAVLDVKALVEIGESGGEGFGELLD